MRRTILLIYALIFVTESLQAALVPLLPRFAHEFGLSDVETGSLLSAATLATVVIGVPIGLLSDRLGAKTLAVGAAFIVGTAAIMQAFAPNYGTSSPAGCSSGSASAPPGLPVSSWSHKRRMPAGPSRSAGS